MDLIAGIPFFGGFLATILPFLVVLGIVVFVHEYGHYIVARWCGIRSEVFSVGFGPVIWSRRDRHGTLWQVAALPLGGYVKFLGDSDGSSRADAEALARLDPAERSQSFHGASVGRRMLTVLAGPVANFVLTIVVFAGVVTWQGIPTQPPTIGRIADGPTEIALQPGDIVISVNQTRVEGFDGIYRVAATMEDPGPMEFVIERDGAQRIVTAPYALPPLVQTVEPLSPASEAGLRQGDLILTAGGTPLQAFDDLRRAVQASGDRPLALTVLRDGAEIDLTITPTERDTQNGQGGFERRVMIGVSAGSLYWPETYTPAPWTALVEGTERMVTVIVQSVAGIAAIINGVIGPENLQGPLGIAQISGETAAQGFLNFVVLIGIISTAIGFLNLLPIPILDGGHFAAFLIEAIRGAPPSPKVMQLAMSIGLGLILLLMVFATYNDIMRLVS